MHFIDAFIADKKLVVRSWADRTGGGVIRSNRSGFGTPMGDKLKFLAELVALARHLHETLHQFLVLLRRLRLFILRRPLVPRQPSRPF